MAALHQQIQQMRTLYFTAVVSSSYGRPMECHYIFALWFLLLSFFLSFLA